jgi:hypothetical protein
MKIPTFPAGLFGEHNVSNLHPFIEGFAHVVNREGRGGNGNQGFHFDTRLGSRGDRGSYFHAILA